jgi:hypothetical protein
VIYDDVKHLRSEKDARRLAFIQRALPAHRLSVPDQEPDFIFGRT